MYNAIIIEDEEMARTLLQGMIELYCPQVNVKALCGDLPSGVKAIHKYKPDLVFLDIELPGHSGLELLDFFDEDVDFSIIFVTAYNRYAIQAFKLSAIDYLLKPIESEDLINAVSLFEKKNIKKNIAALKSNLNQNLPKKIGLNGVSSVVFVDLEDILYFQAEGAYTKVFMKDGKTILASKSLKYFENTLADNHEFYRCHKSYIVNINYITEYVKSDGGYLIVNKQEIGLSPDKVNTLLERMSR